MKKYNFKNLYNMNNGRKLIDLMSREAYNGYFITGDTIQAIYADKCTEDAEILVVFCGGHEQYITFNELEKYLEEDYQNYING